MIISEHDKPLTAEDARKISLTNRDDSVDRYHFRELMEQIKHQASFGHTRYSTALTPRARSHMYSQTVQDALRSMGYRVIEKRAMEWDEESHTFSSEKPILDACKRETFFLEITWG